MEDDKDLFVGIPTKEEKLTEWANEPKVGDLKGDYDKAKPSHNAYIAKLDEWDALLNVTGKEKPKKQLGRSSIQPKLIRRQAEWRYAALSEPFLGSDKIFDITAITKEDVEAARQNELLLNWQFRTKMHRVNFIDDYVRSAVDEGVAIVRVGWERYTEPVTKMEPVFAFYPIEDEESMAQLEQAIGLREESIRMFNENVPEELKASVEFYLETGEPTIAVIEDYEEVEDEEIIDNKPVVEVVNPRNVIVDPSCNGNIDKALFAIYIFDANKAELEKTGLYKNLDSIDWDNATTDTDTDFYTDTPQDFHFTDKLKRKLVAYEYWGFHDINNDGKLVPFVSTWIGDTIIRMEESPFPDNKLPFVIAKYLPIKRSLTGEPDAELLADNQRITGAITRGMIDTLGRSANGQTGTAKGLLDPVNKRRFREGEDYEFNPNNNPQGGIHEHVFPELPQSAYNMIMLQNQDAESLTGVKSFSGGISGESYGDVAAGIRGALDASSKREMAILRRLAQGIKDIGTKIIAMNAVFLSEEEVVRVTDEEYVTILRDELEGNFDLSVDISTAEVDDAKANDLAFMLQTIGNNMDMEVTLGILADIADLKRIPDLAHKLRKFQPEPSPEEQRMAEIEIEKAELENEKIRAEIAKIYADAEKIGADTEQELSGEKHRKNMEQQRAQAQGNQDLELTKALTKPRKYDETAPDIDAALGFNVISASMRDEMAEEDPRYNLGSQYYDPSLDPARNPNLNI